MAGPVGSAGGGAGNGGGGNPFQLVTNLYAEKNIQGVVTAATLSAQLAAANASGQ